MEGILTMKRALVQQGACGSCEPCNVAANCPMNGVFRDSLGERPWVGFYKCSDA